MQIHVIFNLFLFFSLRFIAIAVYENIIFKAVFEALIRAERKEKTGFFKLFHSLFGFFAQFVDARLRAQIVHACLYADL